MLLQKKTGVSSVPPARWRPSVAYVVCQHFGIDTSDYSFGYVAGWSRGKDLSQLKTSLERIRDTAAELIDSIAPPKRAVTASTGKTSTETEECPWEKKSA